MTGLADLQEKFKIAGDAMLIDVIQEALGKSIAMVETAAKRLTPVATGLLRSSIGGEQGFSFVRGLTAGVGTNVKYAIYVEMNDDARHTVGQAHFMEQGYKNSEQFVQAQFQGALEKLAKKLAQ